MAFSGLNFLYGGESSQSYGLQIMSINDNSIQNEDAGSNVEIIRDATLRNPVKFNFGATQTEVLTFDMEIMSFTPIRRLTKSKIEKWLFGRIKPQELRIVQTDLQNVYFNCYLINPKSLYIDNKCYGFSFTVECDAPWGHEVAKTYEFKEGLSHIRFYNDSDNTDYTYPLVEFKMKDNIYSSYDVNIINETDNNRTTSFKNLHAGEIITIDNNLPLIKSSENRLVTELFNKKFFRLLSGLNKLSVQGEIDYIKIKYSNARKIGG